MVEGGDHLMDFVGHMLSIEEVIQANDKTIVSCARREIAVWNLDSGELIRIIFEDQFVYTIAPSKRDPTKFYSSPTLTVKLRSLDNGKCVKQINYGMVKGILELRDGRVAIHRGTSCIVWTHNLSAIITTICLVFDISGLIELENGLLAMVCSGTVVIWNSWTGERLFEFKDSPLGEYIKFTRELVDGVLLFPSTQSLKMWDIKQNDCVYAKKTKGDFFFCKIVPLYGGLLMTYKPKRKSVTFYKTFLIRQSLVHMCCYTIARFYHPISNLSSCLPPELYELCNFCFEALPDKSV
eukprot:TRINITY_DN15459_c0_g1_i1.p1 TRINITY_DN15459_c0_g1~~TRINITY_DN15459_c0_g1_i1.p1  ORF type:complete len:295 (+),score=31.27 TRINITY_DN15459_c0_g1_i1:264-1148(+)